MTQEHVAEYLYMYFFSWCLSNWCIVQVGLSEVTLTIESEVDR